MKILTSLLTSSFILLTSSFICHPQARDAFRNNAVTMLDLSGVASATGMNFRDWLDANKISKVKGSMFLNEIWQPGNLILSNDTMLEGLLWKYNIFTREMQFRYHNDTLAIKQPDKVRYIIFDKKVFVYGQYLDGTMINSDYFQLLADGKTQLLLHRKVIFEPKNPPATPYSAGTTEDHFVRFDNYYIKKNGDALALRFNKSRKELLGALSDKKEAIKKFIKDNDLKIRQEADLIRIVDYYNSLLQ